MRNVQQPIKTLACLVCQTVLRESLKGMGHNPLDAVACKTWGNFGSAVFDPIDGHFLEFNICDACLRKAAEQKLINLGLAETPPVPWTPEPDEEWPFQDSSNN